MRPLLALALALAACSPSFHPLEIHLQVRGPRVASVRAGIELTVVAKFGSGFDSISLGDVAIQGATNCTVSVTPPATLSEPGTQLKVTPMQPGPCLFVVTGRADGRFMRENVSLDFFDADPLLPARELPTGCSPDVVRSLDFPAWIELGDTTYCRSDPDDLVRLRDGTTEQIDERLFGQLDGDHVLTCGTALCHVRDASGTSVASVSVASDASVQVQRGTPTRVVMLRRENMQIRVQRWRWENGALQAEAPMAIDHAAQEAHVWRDMLVTRGDIALSLLSLPTGEELTTFGGLETRTDACDNQLLVGDKASVRLASTVADLRSGGGIALGGNLGDVPQQVVCSLPGVGLLAEVTPAPEDDSVPPLVRLWGTTKDAPQLAAVGSFEGATLASVHPRGVLVSSGGQTTFLERVRRTP